MFLGSVQLMKSFLSLSIFLLSIIGLQMYLSFKEIFKIYEAESILHFP